MVNAELKNKYDEYLKQHIGNVKNGYDWLCIYLPNLIKPELADILAENIYAHDRSKYSDEEYEAYANYFYGTKSKEHDEAFDYAWLHHQKQNPHHWQYWILQNDEDGIKVLEMPEEYVLEMICDHWAFSWAKDNLYEIFNWYDRNKKKMQLHKNTRKLYEDILAQIKEKLDILNN